MSKRAFYDTEIDKKNKTTKILTDKLKELEEDIYLLKQNHISEMNEINVSSWLLFILKFL